MSKKIPAETGISRNPEKREKFLGLYKRYREGKIEISDIYKGMRISRRSFYNTVKRLEYEDSLKAVEEEVVEEEIKKFTVFAVKEADKDKLLYSSPIPKVQGWINEWLSELRPRTRKSYIDYASRCWKFIVEKHGLYDPEHWTLSEVKEYIFSPEIRGIEASSQNRHRSAINSLMKYLGKREIFFKKLRERQKPIVYMSEQTKRGFFAGCKEMYPDYGIIPFTMGVIALKTGTRIGTDKGRDADKPENDRGILCIRTRAVDLKSKPPRIRVRDKGRGEAGYEWLKFLDEEAERYIREYLAWRAQNRRQWKEDPFLFGTTTYGEARDWMQAIREKYDLYEIDPYGNKVWIHWHMLRDNFANECLLAMVGELKEGEEPDMDKGVLACCLHGGWNDPKTFVDRYVAQSTLNRIKKMSFGKLKGKITLGL